MCRLHFVFLCALLAAIANASTPLGGPVMSDMTLTASPDPNYVVVADLVVFNNATLTIEPGVELRFQQNTSLIIGYDDGVNPPAGTLVANGGAPWIRMRGDPTYPPRGYWNWLAFSDFAVDAVLDGQGNYQSGCILANVEIGHAKSVQIRDSSPYLGNVNVYYGGEHGLDAEFSDGGYALHAYNVNLNSCGDGTHDGAGFRLVGGSGHIISFLHARWCDGARGGGVAIEHAGNFTIDRLTVGGNQATGLGGGMLINDVQNMGVSGAWIDDNVSDTDAGAVAVENSVNVRLGDWGWGRIYQNVAAGPTGGVWVSGSAGVSVGGPPAAFDLAMTISNNSGYAIRCENSPGYDVNATENVWCTEDPSDVIYDGFDDSRYAIVYWEPVRPFYGDLNGDQQVSIGDLTQLLSNFGIRGGATYGQGDLDGNGDVDFVDLALFLSRFGSNCA